MPKSLYKEDFLDPSPDEPPLHMGNSLYLTAFVIKDYPNEVSILIFYCFVHVCKQFLY